MSARNDVAVICYLWGRWPEERPELGPEYVNRLYKAVQAHTTIPHDFLCFVDEPKFWMEGLLDSGIERVLMARQFLAYRWNLKKMLMYSALSGLSKYKWVVCLDLDLVVTGDLDFLLTHRSKGITTCRGAYCDRPGGSVVAFRPGEPWQDNLICFLRDHIGQVERDTGGSERKFYHQLCGDSFFGELEYWQDVYPGKILSFKLDGYQKEASIVRFHGRPRPHEVVDGFPWVKENWK